ncbi:hypothetical protein F8M41_022186 [Gigaspora margarita]|uniref:Uncharacterized protein n=1 Tax=Gigaspora margarita TaxID=4874 RepID=A0A8H4AFG2_GIGMA|nr:hypothetical protein F8M41_022186 [Gigaspora margarita]
MSLTFWASVHPRFQHDTQTNNSEKFLMRWSTPFNLMSIQLLSPAVAEKQIQVRPIQEMQIIGIGNLKTLISFEGTSD